MWVLVIFFWAGFVIGRGRCLLVADGACVGRCSKHFSRQVAKRLLFLDANGSGGGLGLGFF